MISRLIVLAVAVTFIALMGILTVLQFADNGVTLVGVIGVGVLVVCGVGIIGALVQPPRK